MRRISYASSVGTLYMFIQLVTSIISYAVFNISNNVCLLLHALSTVNIVQTENTIVKYPVFSSKELPYSRFVDRNFVFPESISKLAAFN